MHITFLGATETVTGSKYLLRSGNKTILVDCGLFQGYKELRLRNWAKLPIDISHIDAVVLTHAHIDHSGYIPLLVKHGFKGKIYCTHPTKDLCGILLPDSGHLQEEEAAFANAHGYSKHTPALPLYTKLDAIRSLEQFQGCDFHQSYQINDHFSLQFNRAGHILGAATLHIKDSTTSILFSGDLGRPHDPVMRPPEVPQAADYLVVESTYGNRTHETNDPKTMLGEIINRTIKRGGTIIIPAFAVGRVQTILYFIHQLKVEKTIPDIPVFLDSPMATNATELFCLYSQEHRLTSSDCQKVYSPINYIHTVSESQELDIKPMPKIIVSASGMATGGRVLHHIKAFANDQRNTILFTGFQAGGTRGDRMIKGESEIKLLGKTIHIKAEVKALNNLSAHADKHEIVAWLKNFHKPPKKVFITHGEPNAALALKQHIEKELHWKCVIPTYLQDENL